MDTALSPAEPLWTPSAGQIAKSNLTRFQHWLSSERNIYLMDARALYDWSIRASEEFWSAIADFFGVHFRHAATSVLQQGQGPQETRWFPGATLNYAEHLLRSGSQKSGLNSQATAALFCSEFEDSFQTKALTHAELLNVV